jgi:hypothetical protein
MCRRQQYHQEVQHVPTFVKLYEVRRNIDNLSVLDRRDVTSLLGFCES